MDSDLPAQGANRRLNRMVITMLGVALGSLDETIAGE